MKSYLRLYGIILCIAVFAFSSCDSESSHEENDNGGNELWTRLSGASDKETHGLDTAVDSKGNVYVIGTTNTDLDEEVLQGTVDSFIIKYNAAGVKQWTRLLGGSNAQTMAYGVAIDSNDNPYMVGYTFSGLNNQVLNGTIDAFIVKYNDEGEAQWTRLSGVAGLQTKGFNLALDSQDNVYLTGYTTGALDGQSFVENQNAFMIKYNSLGVKQWTRVFGSSYTCGNSIHADSNDNVYVTGYTMGYKLDDQVFIGTQDAFVTKYNESGVQQWTKLSGVQSKRTTGINIDVDSSGNVYVTGETVGNLDGETLQGYKDAFVISYNALGEKQWTRLVGASQTMTVGKGIDVDTKGNVYVSGYTNGNLNGDSLIGYMDAFIVMYNMLGERQSSKLFGVAGGYTSASGQDIDAKGKLYIVGDTKGNLNGENLNGTEDAFVSKVF